LKGSTIPVRPIAHDCRSRRHAERLLVVRWGDLRREARERARRAESGPLPPI